MQKKLLAATLLAGLAATAGAAHAQLAAGDIAFTALNADEDGWAIVALAPIAANTTIYFADHNWTGSAFNTTESAFQWVSGPSVIAAGTVIRFSAIDAAGRAASVGTFTADTTSANFGLSATAETVYAFLGSSFTAPTTFLAAVSTENTGTQYTGTGLAAGTNAITLQNSADFGQYVGARTGLATFGAYRPLVTNVANWTVDTTNGNYATVLPDTTAFTVTPIPEPETWGLMALGLGVAALAGRRRRAAAR